MAGYRGFEIRAYETMGNGKTYYEAWKDEELMAFAADFQTLKKVLDRMIDKEEEVHV